MSSHNDTFYCYLLFSDEIPDHLRTYIGYTSNISNRIKCHNGLKPNGAKATRSRSAWTYHTIVSGFKSMGQAMRFEWYWKRRLNRKGKWVQNGSDLFSKTKRLNELLAEPEYSLCHVVHIESN